MSANEHVKIAFDLDPADGHGYETETVWAEPVGGDRFRLQNSPFFAFGVSAEDVVSAVPARKGIYKFQQVVQMGGHSTYRIFLQDSTIADDCFLTRWHEIQALGATYENGNGRFVSVDIPPETDIRKIYCLLEQGEKDGVWAFEEANYEEITRRVQ